jgi:hypothetical protein
MFPNRTFLHRAVPAVFLALVLSGNAYAADSDPYLRGYLQGLVDSRFPDLGLEIRSVAPQKVVVSARTCLGASQKHEIERVLAQSRAADEILWDAVADCERPAPPGNAVKFEALPETELFAPLIADPRQPRFSMSFQHYQTPRQTFNAGSVALGEYFGFASGFLGDSGLSQFGIQAGVFALFNLQAESKDLINADYWIGLPVSYRKGPWSYVARVFHQSSHLGDEFILGNPGINRVNLSYEGLDFLAAYEWDRVRVYGGGGYLIHSEPDLDPLSLHGGVEYWHPKAAGRFDLIAAVDIRSTQESDWDGSYSYQLGFELRSLSRRRARLMLEHFRGHSPNGQFYHERLQYNGIGLYIGF